MVAAMSPEWWKVWRWQLHWQIFLGLAIGAVVGLALGTWVIEQIPADVPADKRGAAGSAIVRGLAAFHVFELLGDLFLRALFLIIVPLITTSIVLAVARIAGQHDFGRLGLKTMAYFFLTSIAAVGVGLVLLNIFTPGIVNGAGILEGRDLSAFGGAQQEVSERVEGRGLRDFLNVFRVMIPNNLVGAAAEGNFLGLIVVSITAGFFTARLPEAPRQTFEHFVEAIHELTVMATGLILRFAPVGVLFLIARTFAEQYATLRPDGRFEQFITGIGSFAIITLVALLIHLLVTLPLVLLFVARVNPLRHYRAMAPALVTAFSTASSAATLPLNIQCLEKRAGVSNRVTGFVLPLGATVNMDGTALYECAAAMFICQAFGVELTLLQQFIIVTVAMLTSIGVAGIPSASLVAIAIILQTVQAQLPPGQSVNLLLGMGLLFVFDRPLDMVRTAVNVFGDSVGAVVVAKSEGETDVLRDGPGRDPDPVR